ncbi:hypothetical protein C493_13128 [Natronolimnohabitans innermongolicus JCM 12255]|uniref:Uncharacterized protein n=1 Tax=Natronolimnohabitans innermongolicus JCM 12255 TaxID=1227499 RepID=L9WX11_9EURY|nr:hypothetical protein C493_13128 [Natronolimnohabitans innermongolicus JCM 12255]
MTAQIVRTDEGTTYTEYEIGGIGYGSLEALKTALESC